ncbi:MAG TPA: AAA family ATPase [Trebonia sp.]
MNALTLSDPASALRLRGRQPEVDALCARIDAVGAGRGGTVFITGLPGLGKTALLDVAETMAREQGIRVLRGTSHVASQMIPLSPLLEALASGPGAPVGPDVLRGLSQTADQRFWLLRELQEALERVALCTPVLIALDDMQWADGATLAAFATLSRQLATHRILWLLAVRDTELSASAHAVFSRMQSADAPRIMLDPLDETAVADIAADVLGGVPDPALLRVLERVEGHPFLLSELLRGMREEKLAEADRGTVRLTGTQLPLRFRDSVNQRLRELPPAARDALQMASVLGRRFSADELTALTGSAPAVIAGALRDALAAGLVAEDGDRMAFRHDLVREAVDAALPRTVRHSLRRQAADVMLRNGAAPSDVAELVLEVARPGDREAIMILRRAAAETGHVSPSVASTLSRRALDLTPPGDPDRGPLTAETIAYLAFAGKATEAVALMTAGAGDLASPVAEAEARLRLAILSTQYSPTDSVEQCRRALELLSLPVALRIQLLSNLAHALDRFGDGGAADEALADAVRLARSDGTPADEAVTQIPCAARAVTNGAWREALGFLDKASAAQRDTQGLVAVQHWRLQGWRAVTLLWLARVGQARAIIDAGLHAAQREGVAAHIREWLVIRYRAMYSAGYLCDARSDAEAVIEMGDEAGAGHYGYFSLGCLYMLGRVAVHAGDPDGLAQARESAARLLKSPTSLATRKLGGWLTALVADADGHPELAADVDLRLLDPLADGPPSASNHRMLSDIPVLTRILLDAGRREDAVSVVVRLEEFTARHPDFPLLRSAALHARAVLDADPDRALEAIALSEDDPRPLVRAVMIEDAGRLLPDVRAAEAVPLLESALASYAEAGAERDAARVRGLLRARGARPAIRGSRSAPDWPELTESEFAVVSLVARGATNRETAEHLHLSPFTVNSHLRHVFSKLALRSRTELAFLASERGLL